MGDRPSHGLSRSDDRVVETIPQATGTRAASIGRPSVCVNRWRDTLTQPCAPGDREISSTPSRIRWRAFTGSAQDKVGRQVGGSHGERENAQAIRAGRAMRCRRAPSRDAGTYRTRRTACTARAQWAVAVLSRCWTRDARPFQTRGASFRRRRAATFVATSRIVPLTNRGGLRCQARRNVRPRCRLAMPSRINRSGAAHRRLPQS